MTLRVCIMNENEQRPQPRPLGTLRAIPIT